MKYDIRTIYLLYIKPNIYKKSWWYYKRQANEILKKKKIKRKPKRAKREELVRLIEDTWRNGK